MPYLHHARMPRLLTALFAVLFVVAAHAQQTVRVGFFPNITHAQALIGQADGTFQKELGPNVKIDWKRFNAGPSVIEALYAGAIDLAYIGPSPTITGYIRSNGEALRVIAGVSSGAASLVVRNGSGINTAADFHHKVIATPQLGNTQDVALREWLHNNGYRTLDHGGDVRVQPTENPIQLTLFLRGQLDASWAPEPWATRLVKEGNGHIFLDERDLWPNHQFVAAHLIVSTKFLKEHPDLVKSWLRAHVDVTEWILAHPAEAKTTLNRQIKQATGKALKSDVLNDAYSRLTVTYDPIKSSLFASAQYAHQAGLLRQTPDLSHLYDLTLLNQVLVEEKKKTIQ